MAIPSKRAFLVIGLCVFFQACSDDTPTSPSGNVSPTPSPSATATPTATLGLACGAPRMGADCGPNCCRVEGEEGQWESHLWSAIQALQDEQPGLFDGQKILDRDRF